MSEKKRTWWYKPLDKIIQKWGGKSTTTLNG